MRKSVVVLLFLVIVSLSRSPKGQIIAANSMVNLNAMECTIYISEDGLVSGQCQEQIPPSPSPSPTVPTDTPTPTETATDTPVPPTKTPKPTGTPTPLPPTLTPTMTPTQTTTIEPFPAALPCTDHDNDTFHTVWNEVEGCHYDHEHGVPPFVPAVTAAFPGFDLFDLLGGVGVGHTNPSSGAENDLKHGGMKWHTQPLTYEECDSIIEDGEFGADSAVIQYHAWGNSAEEFEGSIHSTVALLRLCHPDNPNDKGYIYTVQWQEYGERCVPYQGDTAPYPNNFQPQWNCARGQYFTAPCFGQLADCPLTYEDRTVGDIDSTSAWTSKITGSGPRPPGSTIFNLLFGVRDNPMVFDRNDFVWPFTWLWLCSNDGGLTFDPTGCRYNNSATVVREVAGVIPVEWDNLAGFDTNPAVGRITADGYTSSFGVLDLTCTEPGPGCFPIKMVDMFVGFYSAQLTDGKQSNDNPINTPERDIYFCNGVVCNETDPGAVPSGWIGAEN